MPKNITPNESHAWDLANELNTQLKLAGICLEHGYPVVQGNDRLGTTRIELYFDGTNTTDLYKLICILRANNGTIAADPTSNG
jgi:hypothetical protein